MRNAPLLFAVLVLGCGSSTPKPEVPGSPEDAPASSAAPEDNRDPAPDPENPTDEVQGLTN